MIAQELNSWADFIYVEFGSMLLLQQKYIKIVWAGSKSVPYTFN